MDDEEVCAYPPIRKCSKPSSVAVGSPWKYGPIYKICISVCETRPQVVLTVPLQL